MPSQDSKYLSTWGFYLIFLIFGDFNIDENKYNFLNDLIRQYKIVYAYVSIKIFSQNLFYQLL